MSSTGSSDHESNAISSGREMPTSESGDEDERDYYDDEMDDEYDDGSISTAKPPDGIAAGHVMLAADLLEYVDQVWSIKDKTYSLMCITLNASFQLIESNRISSERGLRLKRKYTALVESIETYALLLFAVLIVHCSLFVCSSRAAENSLLLKARELQLVIRT